MKRSTLTALALATVLAGGSAVALGPIVAEAQSQQTTQQQPQGQHAAFNPGRHLEGRIAYLKTELKITDAQAPAFERVAQAMRDDAKDMAQLHEQRHADHDKPKTAVERLELMQKIGEMRAQHAQRFLAAFKPLYDSLSDEQKKTADELFAHHGHHHHFH